MRAEAEKALGRVGHRVYAIVNDDHLEIAPELVNAWAQMVQGIVDQYYRGITPYTTSNFMRVKLGDALSARGLAPQICESAEEGRGRLRDEPAAPREDGEVGTC